MKVIFNRIRIIALIVFTLTFIFPGYARQGIIYCNDQIPIKNALTCQETSLWSGNGSLFLRFLAVAVIFLLTGLLVSFETTPRSQHEVRSLVLTMTFLIFSFFYSLKFSPQIMFPEGDHFRYSRFVPGVAYYLANLILPSVGLLLGVYAGRWFIREREKSIPGE